MSTAAHRIKIEKIHMASKKHCASYVGSSEAPFNAKTCREKKQTILLGNSFAKHIDWNSIKEILLDVPTWMMYNVNKAVKLLLMKHLQLGTT